MVEAEVQGIEVASNTYTRLAVSLLKVHPDIQRDFDQRWADELTAKWDPKGAGALSVIERPDGTYWVFDGQHRLYAMRILDIRRAWCQVFMLVEGSSEAAQIQLLLGNSRKWHPIDTFKMRVKAGDHKATFINRVVEENGSRIATGYEGYACVRALELAYDLGPEVMEKTVQTIERTWPSSHDGRTLLVVNALGFFHYSFPGANMLRLQDRLAVLPLANAITEAKTRAFSERTSASAELAATMRRQYNKGLQEGTRNWLGSLRTPPRFRKVA